VKRIAMGILLVFGLVANAASIAGLWITYQSAPVSVQTRFAKWLVIGGAIAGAVAYLGVAGLFAYFLWRKKTDIIPAPPLPAPALPSRIFVLPEGVTVRLQRDLKLQLTLQILSTVATELRYIKAHIVGRDGKKGIVECSEPISIPALQLVQFFREISISQDDFEALAAPTVLLSVNGYARFTEDQTANFQFAVRAAA